MGKECITPYVARERKITFLLDPLAECAFEKMKHTSTSKRNLKITRMYLINETITGETLGKMFFKSSKNPSKRVGQVSDGTLQQLWKHSSIELQLKTPPCQLRIRRPTALGEKTKQINKRIFRGDNLADIRQEMGKSVFDSSVGTLRKRGKEIPHFPTHYEQLEDAVTKAKGNNKKLREVINGYTDEQLRGMFNAHKNDQTKVLILFSSVLEEAEFYHYHKNLGIIAKRLEEIMGDNTPPVRMATRQNYNQKLWLTLNDCKEDIVKALKNDPDLQKFK